MSLNSFIDSLRKVCVHYQSSGQTDRCGRSLQVDEIIGAPESAENGESQRFGGVTCRRPRRL